MMKKSSHPSNLKEIQFQPMNLILNPKARKYTKMIVLINKNISLGFSETSGESDDLFDSSSSRNDDAI
jgi:hypothetical protein